MTNKIIQPIQRWSHSAAAPAQVTVFFAALLVASIPTSPFLISISIWGLVFLAFWNLARDEAGSTWGQGLGFWWRLLVFSFQKLFRQREYAFFLLLLLVPVLSGFWSDDLGYWLERSRVRLPFLVLPWALVNMPQLSRRQLQLALYILVWFMVVLCLGVLGNYFLHQDTIIKAMHQGRPMPVPRNHIRFSLMVATTVLAGWHLWQERFVWRYTWERHALGAAILFLFCFVHFLSVRSGLGALYVVLVFSLGRFVWRTRRWKPAVLMLALLALVPWIAVQTMPSLEKKWAYTIYDWKKYTENSGENYSDSERWISLKTGWLIWQEHPILGVGAGDLRTETQRVIKQHFPRYEQTPKLPHNQFLYILASTGLLGFLISSFVFLYPVLAGRYRFNALFFDFQLMAFSSFLVEYTIETSMGVAWYLFFTLWFLKMVSADSLTTNPKP